MTARMGVRVSGVLLLTGVGLVACGGPESLIFGARQTAIIDGDVDQTHHAAMQLAGRHCTGTLIGYRTVLTAAHCLADDANGVWFQGELFPAKWVVGHPGYAFPAHDIAVVRLTRSPPVAPIPIASRPPSLFSEVTIIGFGQSVVGDPNSVGVRRSAEKTVLRKSNEMLYYYSRSYFTATTNICFGDSGGPSVQHRDGRTLVVGVHSSTKQQCERGSEDARVDIYLNWIRDVAEGDVFIDALIPTDRQPPTLFFVAPGQATTSEAATEVVLAAEDDLGVRSVELHVNQVHVATLQSPPYKSQVSLREGNNVIAARVVDVAGKSAEASFNLERTRPGGLSASATATNSASGSLAAEQPSEQPGPFAPVTPAEPGGCNVATRNAFGASAWIVLLSFFGFGALNRPRRRRRVRTSAGC